MLYRFVDAQRADGFPVRMICSVVGVSPSAYYAHKQRPQPSPVQRAEAALETWNRRVLDQQRTPESGGVDVPQGRSSYTLPTIRHRVPRGVVVRADRRSLYR